VTTTSTAGECCNVPHALNLFSSLEAAVSSLNLGGSVFLLTQHADALPRLELTELGLYLDSRLLHLTSNHRYTLVKSRQPESESYGWWGGGTNAGPFRTSFLLHFPAGAKRQQPDPRSNQSLYTHPFIRLTSSLTANRARQSAQY